MQEELRALIRKHCLTLKERVGVLGDMVAGVGRADRGSNAMTREARELAHQITGASGSMGFRPVSAAAAALERYLESLLDRGQCGPAHVQPAPTHNRELKRRADASTPESSALYDADLTAPGARPALGRRPSVPSNHATGHANDKRQ
jgi:chemotaxis protein histidine kinase CheA